MKKFLYVLLFSIVMMIPMNVNASQAHPEGNLVTEYLVEGDKLKVKKVLELSEEYETANLDDAIKLNEKTSEKPNDNFEIDSVIIEDNSGEIEIKPTDDEKKVGTYSIDQFQGQNRFRIRLIKPIKVKKVSIEYSYKTVISRSEEYSFSYIDVPVANSFMHIWVKEQKIKVDNSIKELWVKGKVSNYVENENFKEMIVERKYADISVIMAFDKNNKFLKYEKTKDPYPTTKFLKDSRLHTVVFESENKKTISDILNEFLSLAFVIGSIALVVILIRKRRKRKHTNDKLNGEVYENNITNDVETYTNSYSHEIEDYKAFKMPSYINPAYVGILFNTSEEDIILTILCELIRKDAIEIKVDDNYKKGANIYEKYILSLTENNISLESFEETFIEMIREMNSINLEEINKLVDEGYFDLVFRQADEEYNKYLRDNSREDLSFDEISKSKNIELDKWEDIKMQMTRLNPEEMKKLTIKDLELIHVFSTAVALREENFSLFEIFNSTELRVSKYFTQIRQSFDNGEVIINYLEKTFLKEEI